MRRSKRAPVVVAERVCLRHHRQAVLDEVTFTIPPAVAVAVVGSNGAGKSTLLRAIAGIHRPTRGTISCRHRASEIGYVPQVPDLANGLPLTVNDAVGIGRYAPLGMLRRRKQADRRVVCAAMERLDIAHLADRVLHELSGGQRQRVLIAQAVAQQPALLLLDEPTTGLDEDSRRRIAEVLDAEVSSGCTVITATHDADHASCCHLALRIEDRSVHSG